MNVLLFVLCVIGYILAWIGSTVFCIKSCYDFKKEDLLFFTAINIAWPIVLPYLCVAKMVKKICKIQDTNEDPLHTSD